ncbi:tagatose 1,6-diphosphate aldolase [Meiothermus hypogaeus]|uniref:Tagatose 1,6-diphosphate aldolase n=2 Tax=Meiothermus hypogaeus TaxID=884155 RepID=A0A511QYI6_9DEIN|nr:tagatose 1,6-diphosphate aldolase [Meiothermus hypogaeus]RIH75908.1 Tagatose 1,6-diphosphate aldolase [Meiothermus hypogaeus]GEM82444.1 tagatose 1,6-diphosphate aldolase [Meiothermus hypogaeus NBRC 106114]GIW37501.1 MAG: tagatose 1,6-diphosphate aldolase [Meiothermus sp.]
MKTTPAKARAYARIGDGAMRFGTLAIDQRPPLMHLVAKALGRDPEQVGPEVTELKGLLAETLGRAVTGILIDPHYAFPAAMPTLPRETGLMLTLEHHRFETVEGGWRKSAVIPGWSVEQAVRMGADGLKLLAWHRPDAPPEVVEHQLNLVREVGEACKKADRLFIFEVLPYPLPGEDEATYNAKLREMSLEIAAAFADPGFHVDLYKLAFPGAASLVREFGGSGYSLEDLEADMREYSKLPAPWLLLSGGLGADQFVQMLEAALNAGARGYLAGRAVWQHPLRFYPDKTRVREALREEGLETLARLNELLHTTPPQHLEADWQLAGVAG